MYIYLEKFPGKGQELLKYIHNNRLAASRMGHAGWSKYDEQYRFKKIGTRSHYGGIVDSELWVMYISVP